jgi:hypothetical protein
MVCVYENGSMCIAALSTFCEFCHVSLGLPTETITESPVTKSMLHDRISDIKKEMCNTLMSGFVF